ncbi:tRNA isopentenyl-2-thiomethyl-A-37 hydroxylase MiaE [uncultured Umboniibacter sp.]|uniref:tRNA-(ms[2]io[6]A)-hydroxylase n=1 Tax=uncultured Umboniibacter sp. TaxID=1798917 RepID=UPI00262B32DA|nr:tRNA isopentenyl-2-thiomethyl-A-37 hydroxylase MiaE [uncultured Umboniibacter sp.]
MSKDVDLTPIKAFLGCETPDEWVSVALNNQDIMLIDHANCEKKAAKTALHLIFRYIEHSDLLYKMSRLAREELRHFEQVMSIMKKRSVAYEYVSASRYAAKMMASVRKEEPARLIDTLIIGAFIECRSCERFAKLAPFLDTELGQFYTSLLRSESRHFMDYIELAETLAGEPIDQRVSYFRELEAKLIISRDEEFRFHSGLPSDELFKTGSS